MVLLVLGLLFLDHPRVQSQDCRHVLPVELLMMWTVIVLLLEVL